MVGLDELKGLLQPKQVYDSYPDSFGFLFSEVCVIFSGRHSILYKDFSALTQP